MVRSGHGLIGAYVVLTALLAVATVARAQEILEAARADVRQAYVRLQNARDLEKFYKDLWKRRIDAVQEADSPFQRRLSAAGCSGDSFKEVQSRAIWGPLWKTKPLSDAEKRLLARCDRIAAEQAITRRPLLEAEKNAGRAWQAQADALKDLKEEFDKRLADYLAQAELYAIMTRPPTPPAQVQPPSRPSSRYEGMAPSPPPTKSAPPLYNRNTKRTPSTGRGYKSPSRQRSVAPQKTRPHTKRPLRTARPPAKTRRRPPVRQHNMFASTARSLQRQKALTGRGPF